MKKKRICLIVVVIAIALALIVGITTLYGRKKINDSAEDGEKPVVEETKKDEEPEEPEEPEGSSAEPEITESEPVEELDETKAVVRVTTSNLNLRVEANTDCDVLQVLQKNTEVKQYEVVDGWAHIKVGDIIGYVSAEYLADPAELPKEPETQSQVSGEKVEVIPGQHRDPNSAVVVIDPGHQRSGDSNKEPNGPGSSVMKARVTGGTSGVATGVSEYVLNLDISLKLKTELENRGYTVYMTRSSHDVNISNKERAEYATSVGADIAVRIHANGASNASVNGAETLVPSGNNAYVGHLASASNSLGSCIINSYCQATGFKNRGVIASDTMTGINWSSVPVTIIELGFMSNSAEDLAMQDATMQNNMVQGIANGIDVYFGF